MKTQTTMMSKRAATSAAQLVLLVLVLASCGENLFAPGAGARASIEQVELRGPDVDRPDRVVEGETVSIDVRASGDRNITHVNFAFRGAMEGDTTFALASPTREVDETFTIRVPTPAGPDPMLYIDATVTDATGQESDAVTDSIFVVLVDRSGPQIEILETHPDSMVPLGFDIEVTTHVVAPAGLRRLVFVGLSPRGDPLRGTDTLVVRYDEQVINYPRPGQTGLPQEVTVSPLLSTPDDTTAEPLTIVVVAEDSLGNVSEVTKEMYIGGPEVTLLYPTPDLQTGLGEDFEVRARIDGGSSIDSAVVILSGAKDERLRLSLPPRTDTAFSVRRMVVMPDQPGIVNVEVRAWNTDGIGGRSRVVAVEVLDQTPVDQTPPLVSLDVQPATGGARSRMELTDGIRVTVSASDGNSGVSRLGFTMIAIRNTDAETTVADTFSVEAPFDASRSLQDTTFVVPVDELYTRFGIAGHAAMEALLPDDIEVRVHAFAQDAAGHIACAVGSEEQRLCTAGPEPTAEDTAGWILRLTAVRGHTVLLDNPNALIADLALDTLNGRLFLSNISENLVELLELDADPRQTIFRPSVQVGSQPWGMFVGERVVSSTEPAIAGIAPGDTVPTLIVGNSGGTNMSLVHLAPTYTGVEEVDVVRLLTPNSVLYEITEGTGENGAINYTGVYIDFSDRPQFLAQDSLLRIVYSTVPTASANTSTVRFVAGDPDPTSATDRPEVRFLLTRDMVNPDSETSLVLANIDSVYIEARSGETDRVRVFTHEPGYPDRPIYNPTLEPQFADAVNYIVGQIDSVMTDWGVPEQAPMYYPFFMRGTWDIERVGMSDTTFISASTDRGRIAIGEGASAPTGRILLWNAGTQAELSTDVQISDLLSNASERVLGVGLNHDGSLGVARGLEATYFFTPDLRLQGLYQQSGQGGAGAAFHPDHDSPFDGSHEDTDGAGVAFTGTPTRSIEVVNTFHFNQVNELAIRDNIVGPLRTGPPLPSDNGGAGRACVGDDCIVAKLYGITDAGGVVIINVRRRDLQ